MFENNLLFWQLLLQLFLIGLNAVFACAEIAVISINDNKLSRLAAVGDKRAKRLLSLTKNPAKFLATIQVGITLAGFLGSAFAADNFSDSLVDWFVSLGVPLSRATLDTISVLVITVILSYFTLVLGELVPKRIAMQKAETLGLAMSGPIVVIAKIFAPLVGFLTFSTNTLLRLIGIDPHANDKVVTEEEIRMMVDVGNELGAIDTSEKEIIHNLFDFDNKTASELMTHRTKVTILWLSASDEEWERTIVESKHTIYPVCDEIPDQVVGVLNTREYFRLPSRDRETVMSKAVRDVNYVPETIRASQLFVNMKSKRNHFAVVLDEYGGMSGIITMNDLLEQLVGDLENDETMPVEPPLIEKIDDKTWLVRGTAPLKLAEEILGETMPTDDYDTFAGFVFDLLGRIPADGETPECQYASLTIHVDTISGHRLQKTIVTKSEPTATAKSDSDAASSDEE